MTIGISKERLEEIYNMYGKDLQFEAILGNLIRECRELNPWLPIEQAPKDRELWLYWESTGHMEKSYYNHMCGEDCYATHYQEPPGDPE